MGGTQAVGRHLADSRRLTHRLHLSVQPCSLPTDQEVLRLFTFRLKRQKRLEPRRHLQVRTPARLFARVMRRTVPPASRSLTWSPVISLALMPKSSAIAEATPPARTLALACPARPRHTAMNLSRSQDSFGASRCALCRPSLALALPVGIVISTRAPASLPTDMAAASP